jgi:DNA-binding transcriptional MerR regulator
MHDGIYIGELAEHFGLNPKTIRYYEEIGLLKRADRSEAGYRLYTRQDARRLGFIRRAKALGLSLDEIRGILSVQEEGSPPCRQVLDLIDLKIRAVDQRMAELAAFRAELATLRSSWTNEDTRLRHDTPSACICPSLSSRLKCKTTSKQRPRSNQQDIASRQASAECCLTRETRKSLLCLPADRRSS